MDDYKTVWTAAVHALVRYYGVDTAIIMADKIVEAYKDRFKVSNGNG